MSEPTCLVADTICRTVELGVAITGAAIAEELTWIDCRPVAEDRRCGKCGQDGSLRDHVSRVVTDLPVVGHPTRLRIQVPRFVCGNDECTSRSRFGCRNPTSRPGRCGTDCAKLSKPT